MNRYVFTQTDTLKRNHSKTYVNKRKKDNDDPYSVHIWNLDGHCISRLFYI